ncbi:hypothetical protein ACFYPN_00570 [Streptomyces sp. NPDC005576]|uniref:hypothetical protein n=1 Tax=unclassified Streptomyces TaxID=2593676 RepID=UPI0033CE6CB6
MKLHRTARARTSIEPPPGYYTPQATPPDDAQRGLVLDWAVTQRIADGWRVESRSWAQAVLVRGQPVNHVLHAFLTVFTCFLWAPVWLVLTLVNKVERAVLTVDAQGHIVTVVAPT